MPLDQMHTLVPDADPREMSFFEHLDELRRALVVSILAIMAGTIVGFVWHKPILDLLRAQVHNVQFIIVSPAEGFTAVLRMSIMLGLFLGLPVILRELFWFVGPALTKVQRIVMIPITVISYLLFIAGVMFAYFVLLPLGVTFLIGFTPSGIQPMLSIDRYIGFAAMLIFSTGLMFQVPIVMLMLSLFGMLRRSRLSTQRRYALLISFIVAAIITPSIDIMTQSLLAGTLILLFEIGLTFMWLVEKIRPPRPEPDYTITPDPEQAQAEFESELAQTSVAETTEALSEMITEPSVLQSENPVLQAPGSVAREPQTAELKAEHEAQNSPEIPELNFEQMRSESVSSDTEPPKSDS